MSTYNIIFFMSNLFLITNPGSASRKYALYDGDDLIAELHFEYEDGSVICALRDDDGKKDISVNIDSLTDAVDQLDDILEKEGYISQKNQLAAIVARMVAPMEYFVQNRIVDDEFMENLEIAKKRAPLHAPVIATEIERLHAAFPETKIISISDMAFHWDKPDLMKYYAFDPEVADKFGIKRYGFHGLSYVFVTDYLKKKDLLAKHTVIAHLGSGSSVSAIFEGKSMDNTMGYTPLEGLCMSTRAGDMDVAAALALKRELGFESDSELEIYLNKKCGLLGLTSGETDDMREVIKGRDEGEKKATFAHSMFVYRAQCGIAKMAATMGDIDALVFTATIGERSDEIRRSIVAKLKYLGFELDQDKNKDPEFDGRHALISSESSKPIYVVKTNETSAMIRRAQELLQA